MTGNSNGATRLGTVRELLAEVVGREVAEKIADDDQLFERMLLDSLQLLTLVSALEERFGIAVTPDDLVPENFESIQVIAGFVGGRTTRA